MSKFQVPSSNGFGCGDVRTLHRHTYIQSQYENRGILTLLLTYYNGLEVKQAVSNKHNLCLFQNLRTFFLNNTISEYTGNIILMKNYHGNKCLSANIKIQKIKGYASIVMNSNYC